VSAPPGPGAGSRRPTTKDADEELARRFLATVLNVPVTVHDKRSGHSAYDLQVRYPGGRRGAAEVVSTRIGKQAAQARAVRGAGYTPDGRLSSLWIAHVTLDAEINKLLPALPQFLAELDQAGIRSLSRNRYHGPELRERLRRLHVSSCTALPPTAAHPPGFYVLPEVTGAWVGDGEEIRLFCEQFLRDPAQADVQQKLASADTDERHSVIITTPAQIQLHTAVDLGLTPTQAPSLPAWTDWLWVIASQALPARGCYWSPAHGWATALLM
jgi:hypothetical protein